MPHLSRRTAIRLAVGVAGAAAFGAAGPSPAADADSPSGFGFILVSDFFIDQSTTSDAAIAAALGAASTSPPGTVDFGGVSYVTLDTVRITHSGLTLQNGGITAAGQFPALVIEADDVTCRGMQFSRSQSSGISDSGFQRSCVSVSGKRFRSNDCRYLATNLACVYLSHAACDGALISGGEMTGCAAVHDGSGVYAQAGLIGNRNITINSVYIHDLVQAILLFDTGDSLIENNRVERMRKLATVPLTGWSQVGNNVWRQRSAAGTSGVDGVSTDREDGPTNTISVDGKNLGEVLSGTMTPSANGASSAGGYVYIDLEGADPNSATILSDIVSGYAYAIYAASLDAGLVSRNKICYNSAVDCDGFGIYLQLRGNANATGNHVLGNSLSSVCLAGVQHASLPYAGIGITGGSDTLLSGNNINGVGAFGENVPGIRVDFPVSYAGTPSGNIIGTTVTKSFGPGFDIRASNWSLQDCRAQDNRGSGFLVAASQDSAIVANVTLTDCHAHGNGRDGFSIDGSALGVGSVAASIVGGSATANAGRGVSVVGDAASGSVTGLSETSR